jgi:hypothetical protein
VTTHEAEACAACSRDWYESMFRAHGLASSVAVADGVWTCRGVAPPYHSNALTLTRSPLETQAAALSRLAESIGRPFTVKDSFRSLDLAPLGLRPLFDAEWIWREPALPAGKRSDTWKRVMRPSELSGWETAWRANGSPTAASVFNAKFLADKSVALFAAHRGDEVVAGFAGHRSSKVVGLSNFFSAVPDVDPLLADALDELARFSPARPIVGYEGGEALERARRLGFRTVGPLRVWTSDA